MNYRPATQVTDRISENEGVKYDGNDPVLIQAKKRLQDAGLLEITIGRSASNKKVEDRWKFILEPMLTGANTIITDELRDKLLFSLSEKVADMPIPHGDNNAELAAIAEELEAASTGEAPDQKPMIKLTRQFLEKLTEESTKDKDESDYIPKEFKTGDEQLDAKLNGLDPESIKKFLSNQGIRVEARFVFRRS